MCLNLENCLSKVKRINAVSIVVCKSVCFGRNAQSLEQLTCCLHLGAVVVAVQVKDPN